MKQILLCSLLVFAGVCSSTWAGGVQDVQSESPVVVVPEPVTSEPEPGVILVGQDGVAVQSASTVIPKGLQWRDERVSMEITGYTGTETELILPAYIDDTEVIAVGGLENKGLTSVILPYTTTVLRKYALRGNRLTSIVIPDRMVHVGAQVVYGNPLTSIVIGFGLDLGDSTNGFDTTYSISDEFDKFYIDNGRRAGLYTLVNGAWTFTPTTATSSGPIRLGAATIDRPPPADAFRFPAHTSYIPEKTYFRKKLGALYLPKEVDDIGPYAFAENEITSITFEQRRHSDVGWGGSLEFLRIRDHAFANNKLTRLELPPDIVVYIYDYAFAHNELAELIMPPLVYSSLTVQLPAAFQYG